jgi:hypothetical protein
MRRLLILVSDQLAAGITDVVLDCAAVRGEDVTEVGVGLVVKLANQLRDRPRRGTLTLTIVGEALFAILDRHGFTLRGGPFGVERAFPSDFHGPEAFHA